MPNRIFTAKHLGLAVGLLALCAGCKNSGASLSTLPDKGQKNGPRLVRVTTVSRTTSSEPVRATGTTLAPSTTKVMPLVPGLITSIPVKEGQVVKRGEVLARLDQRGFRLGLRQARAAVEAAKVGLEATEREKKRFEELFQAKATAKAQLDQITDKYRGAVAGYKQAQVALDMAKKALADSVIRAPYSGVIIKKLASLGDYATAMPPTVLVVMMDISRLNLNISLPERELSRVKIGDAVKVELDGVDRTVQTQIARIVRMVDPMTRSFTAIAEIPNDDLSLKAGLFAKVEITASDPRKRLLVPNEAVLDEGNGVYAVYVVEKGEVVRRKPVTVTAADRDSTEVVKGLQDQETLVLNPVGLLDGDTVKVDKAGDTKTAAREAGR